MKSRLYKLSYLVGAANILLCIWLGVAIPALANEAPSCSETPSNIEAHWTDLSIHQEMQTQDCHSQISDALKAQSGTNEVLSHAVYHQILAGESFRGIPFWPDKHEDWFYNYDDYDYAEIFRTGLNAARESWDEGFEGGAKHDFKIGLVETTTRTDFQINDYRERTGKLTGIKSYLVLPGTFLFLLVLVEKFIDWRGWFPGLRLFYSYKYRDRDRS